MWAYVIIVVMYVMLECVRVCCFSFWQGRMAVADCWSLNSDQING